MIDRTKLLLCQKFYIEHSGRNHKLIEQLMREHGYPTFSSRCLYFSNGRPGWIERFEWKEIVSNSTFQGPGCKSPHVRERETVNPDENRSIPPAVSGGFPSASGFPSEPGAIATGLSRSRTTKQHENTQNDTDPHSAFRDPNSDESFPSWLKRTSPQYSWKWAYQKLIYEKLADITSGKTKRLMIFLPPRHGKSELVTVRYSAWRLQNDPTLNIILASYNQRLANRFSNKVKRTLYDASMMNSEKVNEMSVPPAVAGGSSQMTSRPKRNVAPGNEASSNASGQLPATAGGTDFDAPRPMRPRNSSEEWETRQGGGVRAVGVGGGITGFGAGLVIIDDPVKSREQAESETYREKIYEWYKDDLYTRLEPDAPIILIQTRWHEDDLAGRLIKEMHDGEGDDWEIISLPAIAEDTENAGVEKGKIENVKELKVNSASHALPSDPSASSPSSAVKYIDVLGRMPGEALCPQRYNIQHLLRAKQQLGSYSFSALYQQNPVPADGAIFKRNWFKVINAPPPNLKWKRGYDLAVSTRDSADYTASFKCAFDQDGNLYIADGFRARINYPEQRRFVIDKMLSERDTEHGIELALHGTALVQDLRREWVVRRTAFRGVRVTSDKVSRALAWSNLAEEGRVFLIRGPWNNAFIEECSAFPKGTNDDQIDAVSIAFNMLSTKKHAVAGF